MFYRGKYVRRNHVFEDFAIQIRSIVLAIALGITSLISITMVFGVMAALLSGIGRT